MKRLEFKSLRCIGGYHFIVGALSGLSFIFNVIVEKREGIRLDWWKYVCMVDVALSHAVFVEESMRALAIGKDRVIMRYKLLTYAICDCLILRQHMEKHDFERVARKEYKSKLHLIHYTFSENMSLQNSGIDANHFFHHSLTLC